MTLSQGVAGRSRPDDVSRDFVCVSNHTPGEFCPNPLPFVPWKPTIFGRVRERLRGQCRDVMETLIRLAGPDGRCWVSMARLALEGQVDIKTARKWVSELHRAGFFLRAAPMTWASLSEAMREAGRPTPWKDNYQQAPYLFTVLDGNGQPGIHLPEAERRGRSSARRSTPPRRARGVFRHVENDGKTSLNETGEGYQTRDPRGLPNLVADRSDSSDPLDPQNQILKNVECPARERDGQQAPLVEISLEQIGGDAWREAWAVLVEAHAVQCEKTYGTRPDRKQWLQPDDPRDAGERFAKLSRLFVADMRHQCGVELDAREGMQRLAAKTMEIWFSRPGKNNFLLDSTHPLGRFCEELNGRVREARKTLLRENRPKPAPKPPEEQASEAPRAVSWAERDAARRAAMAQINAFSTRPDAPLLMKRPNFEAPVLGAKPAPLALPEAPRVDAPLLAREAGQDAPTREGPRLNHASTSLDHVAAPLGPSARQGVPADPEDAPPEGQAPPE